MADRPKELRMKRACVLASIVTVLSIIAVEADAAPFVLTPSSTSCTSGDNSNPNGAAVLAKVQACFAATSTSLNLYYKANVGGVEEGSFLSSYNTVFANTGSDPSEATISYLSGLAIECPECYLVVKGGGPKSAAPFVYFFNLASWTGTDTIQLNGFWPAQGAISNVALWGAHVDVTVPEPATLLLFGAGIAGFASRRLRRRLAA